MPLHHLRTEDGAQATEATVTDPARWAVFMVEDTAIVDAATGEPVDEDDVDWTTEHHPDRQPADGLRHADTVVEKTQWQPEYYCLGPQLCGLVLAEFLTRARPIATGNHPSEDSEAQAEAARQERRKVLALNKLGVAAQEVRRAWIRDHLVQRKTPVKGAMVFVTTCLQRSPALLADHAGTQVFGDLLGKIPLQEAVGKLSAASDARAQVLLLAMVLAALEGRTPKDAWRHAADSFTPTPGPTEYLTFLTANGYTPSAIEKVLTREASAEDVYREATSS